MSEYDGKYDSKLLAKYRELEAENERLRNALGVASNDCSLHNQSASYVTSDRKLAMYATALAAKGGGCKPSDGTPCPTCGIKVTHIHSPRFNLPQEGGG